VIPTALIDIAKAIAAKRGRALLVGGYVRDQLRGAPGKDLDVEVYGLELDELEAVLGRFGEVNQVGRSFGVLRLSGLDVDFALPRKDHKIAAGHKGFAVGVDPAMSFAEAARRRDLTINSMALDPLSGELLDPHNGRADLARRLLRATDPSTFAEDPLRGLRVAQFAARFDMQPDAELYALCRRLDLSELSPERLFGEFSKLLLKGQRPSLGLAFLSDTEQIRFFPELAALIGVPQDPAWHPEGDVWTHTLLVVDAAATLRTDGPDDPALMFGALCHDLGKPETTAVGSDGRWRSAGHDTRGAAVAARFLDGLRAPHELAAAVSALTEYHLAPDAFVSQHATAKAYRRLARHLATAGVSVELLSRLARADHLGRRTAASPEVDTASIDAFLRSAAELEVHEQAPRDVVMGRHLVARGLTPGPAFARILAACRDLQDETGWQDPERLLARVLAPK
jgi:tRNA nucleotidyltransferase (CCA-adding enzyme)